MANAAARRLASKWIRNPSDEAAIAAGYYFDRDSAERICAFFPRFLRHSVGRWARRPFEPEPWQVDYLSRLFGWRRPDGRRRFRESYLEVPKKNGKSAMMSGLGLEGLLEDHGAEVYIGAMNRKQARIIYGESARMVASSPGLAKNFRVIETTATITFPARNSKLVAMSADAEAQDGLNASRVIFDEVHRFKHRRMYDVMKYAGAARLEPLLVCITTAGTDRNSLCYQLHKRGLDVLNGVTTDLEFLPVIYAADEADDLDDPATWRKANPSLGVILSLEDFRAEYEQAKRIPGQLNNFKRLRFNIWTDSASRWLPFDLWDAGLDQGNAAAILGATCFAGLDLSSVRDLTSLSLVFPGGTSADDFRIWNHCWMPEETIDRRSEVDQVPYREWVEAGWMTATPGNATDYAAIRSKLARLRQEYDIERVGIDPWNAQSLVNDLIDDEFDVVEVHQQFPTLTGPSKELERLLLAGRVRHDGNPVLRWAVGNCAIETDAAGNIKPSKRRSAERIDPVVSTVIGLALCSAEAPRPKARISVLSPDE